MRLLELFVSGLFDVGDVIVGVFHRQNELRQFDLESLCVVVLRVLNKKDHEESYDRRAGIDDELPGVAVVKDRATYAPHQDHRDRRQKKQRACLTMPPWHGPFARKTWTPFLGRRLKRRRLATLIASRLQQDVCVFDLRAWATPALRGPATPGRVSFAVAMPK